MSFKSGNIKSRIIIPIIIVGVILISLSLTGGYWLQKNSIDDLVHQQIFGVQRLFEELLREESRVMEGHIDFLKTDQVLLASFLAGDRAGLVDRARPLFERMRAKYRITHFYFHGKDRVCFLRVHSPSRHGDIIDRFTMAGAAAGKPFHGIELGPLGTFTLRVVHPWTVDGRVEGYIELGMEIEHLTQLIKKALNVELLVLIDKKFLKREDWEAGLKILNRNGNWDLFHDFAIIDQTIEGSPILAEKLGLHQKDGGSSFTLELQDRHYKGEFEDLIDAGGRRLGEIVSLVDISPELLNLVRMVCFIAGLSLAIGSGLLLFFNNYIGDIQNRLVNSRTKLLSEIKKRRRNEEALAVSERRFRSLFEESKDAILSTDMEGNLLMVNPAGMEMFGLSDHNLAAKNFQDFYVDRTMARKFSVSIRKQGYLRNFGVQLYGKGGTEMDCLMTITTKLGADGVLAGYEGIVRDVTPFKRMEEELRRLAAIDSLTGINNRRNFMELAQKEMNRSRRYGHPFSLIMLDIDHFKKINDTYGHASGDQVLSEFCDVCLKELRESDIMGRLGGEEFVVALVESEMEAAEAVAERIRDAVSSHAVTIDNEEIHITVSLGVTGLWHNDDLDSMLERADNALYRAKENGRNQVRTNRMKTTHQHEVA